MKYPDRIEILCKRKELVGQRKISKRVKPLPNAMSESPETTRFSNVHVLTLD